MHSSPALSPRFFGMARGEYIINDDPEPFDDLDRALAGFEEEVSEVGSADESDHDGKDVVDMDTWELSDGDFEDLDSPTKRDPKRKRYTAEEAEEGDADEEPKVDGASDNEAAGEPRVDEIGRKDAGKEFSDADMAWVEEQTKTIRKQKACLNVIDKALNQVAVMRGIVLEASKDDEGGSLAGVLSHRMKTMNDPLMSPKVTGKNLRISIPPPPPAIDWKGKDGDKKNNDASVLNKLMANALNHHLWDPVKAAKNAKRELHKHKKQRVMKPRT